MYVSMPLHLSPLAQSRGHLKCVCVCVHMRACLIVSFAPLGVHTPSGCPYRDSQQIIKIVYLHDSDHMQLGITFYFSVLIKYAFTVNSSYIRNWIIYNNNYE